MKIILLFFFVFLIIFHCGLYFVASGMLTGGDTPTLIIIRAERRGEPFTGTLRLHHAGGDEQWQPTTSLQYQNLAYYLISNVSDPIDSFDILDDNTDNVLISVSARELRDNRNLNINLDTGRIDNGIGFMEYLTGLFASMGGGWILTEFVGAIIAYFLLVLVPLAFVAMVYSIVREKSAGLKRRFSGSYFRMVFGFFMIFGLVGGAVGAPDELNELFSAWTGSVGVFYFATLGYLIAGWGLYIIACRSFNADEIRARLSENFSRDLAETGNYTYTVTTWSDGSKTSDEGTAFAANLIAFAAKYIIITIFMPVATYTSMISYYLIPIINREPSWKVFAPQYEAPAESYGMQKYEQPPVYNETPYVAPYAPEPPVQYSPPDLSQYVMAYWPADGYYYPARITQRTGDIVDLSYLDGERRQAGIKEVKLVDAIYSMPVESNWERRGAYYPCRLYVPSNNCLGAVYDADGVREAIDISQVRMRL